jgi:hypothetical protein
MNNDLVEVPVKALFGPALAYAVAAAMGYGDKDGLRVHTFCTKPGFIPIFTKKYDIRWPSVRLHMFKPEDASTVLQIMQAFDVSVNKINDTWWATRKEIQVSGSTPAIAVLRCYVIKRVGEFVKVPSEFV